jgi:hypothetical protein
LCPTTCFGPLVDDQCPVPKRPFCDQTTVLCPKNIIHSTCSEAIPILRQPSPSALPIFSALSRYLGHTRPRFPFRHLRSALVIFPPIPPAMSVPLPPPISAPLSRYFLCALPPSPPRPFVIPTAFSPDFPRMLAQSPPVGTRTSGVKPGDHISMGDLERIRWQSRKGGAEMAGGSGENIDCKCDVRCYRPAPQALWRSFMPRSQCQSVLNSLFPAELNGLHL